MEQAGVIRALRKNAQEDARIIELLTLERDGARKEVDRYREKLDLSPIHWEV